MRSRFLKILPLIVLVAGAAIAVAMIMSRPETVRRAPESPAPLVRTITVEERFSRGDCNNDDQLNIADGIYLAGYLFVPGTPPPDCLEACNANDDATLNIADVQYIFSYLFSMGPPPPPPFPHCGSDPSLDSYLGCLSYSCP